eukprot:6209920-Pleurochrysis_carterae.AAC.1
MASTSAPRARSSASRVDGASPSPANASSTRHAAAVVVPHSGASPAGPSSSRAPGDSATQ